MRFLPLLSVTGASPFESNLLVDLLGGLGTIIVGFFLAMFFRALVSWFKDYSEHQAHIEDDQHLVDSFLLGIDADADHAAVAGFISEWPKFKAEHTEIVQLVRQELGNGGHSTADQVRQLGTAVAELRTKVDMLVTMFQGYTEGRAHGK